MQLFPHSLRTLRSEEFFASTEAVPCKTRGINLHIPLLFSSSVLPLWQLKGTESPAKRKRKLWISSTQSSQWPDALDDQRLKIHGYLKENRYSWNVFKTRKYKTSSNDREVHTILQISILKMYIISLGTGIFKTFKLELSVIGESKCIYISFY